MSTIAGTAPALAPLPTASAPPKSASQPVAPGVAPTYRTQANDTHDSVAKQFGVSTSDLKAANPALADKQLMPGDVLSIPQPGAQAHRTESVAAKPADATRAYTREQARADAKTFYDATEGGVTGIGTDEEKMFGVLEGKSKADIEMLRQEYKAQYGHDFEGMAKDRIKGNADHTKRFEALMQGPEGRATSDSLAIGAEIHSNWANEKAVIDRIQNASPEQRQAMVEAYAKHYGPPEAGQSAQDFFLSQLDKKLNASEMDQARGLLSSKTQSSPQADAVKIHEAFGTFTNNKEDIQAALQGKSKAQIAEIDAAYQKQYGQSLESAIQSRSSGAERDVLLRHLNPPQTTQEHAQASAERLFEAVDGIGATMPSIRKELEGKSKQEIQQISDAYERKTGEKLATRLDRETRGVFSDAEHDEVMHALNVPDASDKEAMAKWQLEGQAKKLRTAVEGVGANKDAIRDVIKNNTKEQNIALGETYKQLYGEDLRGRLDSEVGGRENLELVKQLYDRGAVAKGDVQESVNRVREKVEEERSGLGLTDFAQKAFHVFQDGYESDADRMGRHLGQAEDALQRGDQAAAQDEVAYTSNDLKSVVGNREAVTDAMATGAAVVGAVGATVLTAGMAAPVIMGAAALTSGAATFGVHALNNGQAGMEHALKEGAIGTLTGAIPLGKGAQLAERVGANVLERSGSKMLSKVAGGGVEAMRSGIQGAKQGGLDGALRAASDGSTWRDGNGVQKLLTETVSSGLTGFVMGGATDVGLRSAGQVGRLKTEFNGWTQKWETSAVGAGEASASLRRVVSPEEIQGGGRVEFGGVTQAGKTGQLRRAEALLTEADPARAVLGPASVSHPEEIAAMRRTLLDARVEVIDRPGAMAYSPGLQPGRPGQLVIDPDASYSAWLHEYQHAMDDQALGWGGMRTLFDSDLRWQWEQNAYQQEINFMQGLGHDSVVEQLRANMEAEKQKIFSD